jgi:LmbE family N-acetylglucosaminyl deacetylase
LDSKRRILAFSPHADDITIYCGGTLVNMVREGAVLIAVRITDDYTDSLGLTKEETIRRNREECEHAYRILGAEEIIHLEYPSDSLAEISEIKLREKVVSLIRKYQPFTIVGFDPDGRGEENLDHVVCAWAMAEASWTCGFDKHYPEHFAEGLQPAFVPERLLYSRYPHDPNWVVDISESIEIKIQALQAQKTMMEHIFYQYEKMAEICGVTPPFDANTALDEKVERFFRSSAKEEGRRHGVPYAESLRRIFGAGPVQYLGGEHE